MSSRLILLLAALVMGTAFSFGQKPPATEAGVVMVWEGSVKSGSIEVSNGKPGRIILPKGGGKADGSKFAVSDNTRSLQVHISEAHLGIGPDPTIVHVRSDRFSFSFLLRDVNREYPVYLPQYKVAVSAAGDTRSYGEIEKAILERKTFTKVQQIEKEPETSFEAVAPQNKDMNVPIWLGIGRDMRMFDITEELQDVGQEGKVIRPKYASSGVRVEETKNNGAYIYVLGRGVGAKNNVSRRLDKGVLPIYHSELKDDDVVYNSISFVSFAGKSLTEATNKGTHYVVSDKHSYGRSFKDEHKAELEERMKTAYSFDEDMVLYSRTTIENTGRVPRYAWLKAPRPGTGWWYQKIHNYDEKTGFSSYTSSNNVFCISHLNGEPLPNEEVAILLKPGEKAEYDFFMPHSPISAEKAGLLAKQSFPQRLAESRKYWEQKLAAAGKLRLPEKRIEEMLQAGLLHLDLVTFGQGPQGTLSANVGVYSPIGTESSPIIQFYLSMGWFDVAKRALNYFLDTQLKNGFIQNFEGYTVETGAALWNMGEYVRYTGDSEWLQQSKARILKSCEYLMEWREKNKKEELRKKGYGMIAGKVADPEDHFHQFMLNGYGYLGLSRIAEALKNSDPELSARLGREAAAWKNDIRETVGALWGHSPVVPLGDGRWVPTLPPWAEADGPRNLYLKKETFWSHGTFTGADALLGPLYLVFCEVIDPQSPEAATLLDYHSELYYQGNSAFSQPYYSRHNWLQAKLGMVKPFLSTYYNTFSAHADRGTYTFWEHMYRLSAHKTHEEAWFLMETRWMLYMEDGDTLGLLKTIPRAWLEDGKEILLEGVKSYFGEVTAKVSSNVEQGFIEAAIDCPGNKKPRTVTIRLPHPENKRPAAVTGGVYDEKSETVTIKDFNGSARVRVTF
ncbi:hypothetical protein [Ravibacter arvi]